MNTKVTEENLGKLSHKEQVKFALFCAKQIEHLITAKEAKVCIEVTERWLRGEASQEECCEATAAAYDAAYDAAFASIIIHADAAVAARAAREAAYVAFAPAYAAANAAFAAARAANAAVVKESNKAKVTKEQEEYLYELINIDLIVEQNLLA